MKRCGSYRGVVAAATAVLVVLLGPAASAQEGGKSFTASVALAEESELCASAQNVEECEEIAAGASGDVTATVTGESNLGSVQFDVAGCPDDRAGAMIVVTGAAEGATVEGDFQGAVGVGDETQEIHEHVGPVTIGGDGTAHVSLCASASGAIDPGSGDLLGGLIETILDLLRL